MGYFWDKLLLSMGVGLMFAALPLGLIFGGTGAVISFAAAIAVFGAFLVRGIWSW